MDEDHLIAAVRYVSLNPVRARLVTRAEDWPWSSAKAHLAGQDDGLVTVKPVLDRVRDFAALLASEPNDAAAFSALRQSERSGRPLANADFIVGLERLLGRRILRRAPGRKKASAVSSQHELPLED
jgi:putative transposase